MSINDLQRCIEKRKANNSQAREVIFRVLLDADECLNVAEILSATKEICPKKISLNTVYRHLNFFIECGLVISLQNESKKAYYSIADQNNKIFTMCPKCGRIQKVVQENDTFTILGKWYRHSEYITIHKKCERCI
ncbi:Fur family transcriptional regulator [Sulfurovum mangrovi]|uniref:Fur family transcriptional regulator n=1 Tax=Sulfurovum mangrovi TaxID=2893889 RepID=UPI001E4F0633|nr:transcriptional repressor [Sulfurovum mangrovi]UFH58295.1 transcriptional repressor [Sulfurovum mangrovi]